MMIRILISIASAMALPVSPAAARDWGNISGWYVTSGDKSCGMYAQPKDARSAEFLILKRLDGALYLQAQNPSWNFPFGSEDRIQYQIDGKTYGGAQKTVALAGNPATGLLGAVGADFEQEVRGGTNLAIIKDGRPIEQFSLSGSSAAFATLQSCLDDLRASGKAYAAPGFASLPAKAATPRGDVSRWIDVGDYPKSALRDRREGTTGFRLTIDEKGRVFGCSITRSSGHNDLDASTCDNITKRARFDPAEDSRGAAVTGSYESRVSWKVP
jgi:TonB family protein